MCKKKIHWLHRSWIIRWVFVLDSSVDAIALETHSTATMLCIQCFHTYWITNANRIIRLSEVLILICWMHTHIAHTTHAYMFHSFNFPFQLNAIQCLSFLWCACAFVLCYKSKPCFTSSFFFRLNLFVTFFSSFVCSFYVCTSCIHAISRDSHWYRNTLVAMMYAMGFSVFFLFILSFFYLKNILSPWLLCLLRSLSPLIALNDIYLSVFVYFSLHRH